MVRLGAKLVLIDRVYESTGNNFCKAVLLCFSFPILCGNQLLFKLTILCQQILILRLDAHYRRLERNESSL